MNPVIPVPEEIDCVLFDVGNVLADDFWERIVLAPREGVADTFGIPHAEAADAGAALWPLFVTDPGAVEDEWWRLLQDRLGLLVSPEERARLNSLVRVNHRALERLRQLREGGRLVGVVTDNTAFWFPRQAAMAGLTSLVTPTMTFTSFQTGVTKRTEPGLYDVVASQVDPASTLVVDDREVNLTRARETGFATQEYAFHIEEDRRG